jgi:hypothetical protein
MRFQAERSSLLLATFNTAIKILAVQKARQAIN